MGTAVLHPQDCLAGPQNDRNRQFLCVSDCPSSVSTRHSGRAFSAIYEPSTECGRHVTEGNIIPNRGRGLLSCKNSSAGLLPLPEQALQSVHKLAPGISASRFGEIADSHGSKHFSSSRHSNFSSYASELCIPRRPSVPMLDHAAHTLSVLSECFPLHGVQIPERRPLRHDSRVFLNSAQGSCMAASLSCTGGTAISCQKLNFLANSNFSDVFDPVHVKRADSIDQSADSELCQVEVYLGRQCRKPPFKVLPDGQGKSICTKTSTVGRKFVVNKQLKKSVSEKLQGRSETPVLQGPGAKEATRKLITRPSEGLVGSHTGTYGSNKIKFASSAPATLSLEGKIENGPRMQDTQGRMCLFKKGAARSSPMTYSQQMGGNLRNVGASLQGQCHGSGNAAVEQIVLDAAEHKDVNEGDQMTDIVGFVSQDRHDLCKVDVTGTLDNQSAASNIRIPGTVVGSEEILRSRNSVLDNDEMWVSMMNDERWAGPSFFNSPSPSSLPVPSFSFLSSRTLPANSKPAKTADYGAHMVSDKSFLEAKRTWDVAFATKDLRRILHLDHASCGL